MKFPWGSGPDVALPLDGAARAKQIKAELTRRVADLKASGVRPGLATILVGDDPASEIYVSHKHKDCEEVGIASQDVRLPVDATQGDVEAAIDTLNADPACSAYILQLPVPAHLDTQALLERIDPAKDADGLHPYNLGVLVQDVDGTAAAPQPCTPRGVIDLLQANQVDLRGATVCVLGRGLTVGRPLSLMLTQRGVDATVTVCHTATKDVEAQIAAADVVVAAAGVPGMVKADFVKPGAVVVDVGVARQGGRVQGDVAEGVEQVASMLTPNPGGVGPMTRAMLLRNVVDIAARDL